MKTRMKSTYGRAEIERMRKMDTTNTKKYCRQADKRKI